MQAKIVLIPGDGVGPEVVKEARSVLEAVARRGGHRFEFGNSDSEYRKNQPVGLRAAA